MTEITARNLFELYIDSIGENVTRIIRRYGVHTISGLRNTEHQVSAEMKKFETIYIALIARQKSSVLGHDFTSWILGVYGRTVDIMKGLRNIYGEWVTVRKDGRHQT